MPDVREVSKTNEREWNKAFVWDEYNELFEWYAYHRGLNIIKRNLPYSYAEWRLEAEQYGIKPMRMWKIWLFLVKIAKGAFFYESQDGQSSIKPGMSLLERNYALKALMEEEE